MQRTILILALLLGSQAWAQEDPWNGDQVNDIRLTFANPDDWREIRDVVDRDRYRPARFEWGSVVLDPVGVRLAGEGSVYEGSPKPSLRIKFNQFESSFRFFGLKNVRLDGTLSDASFLRDRLCYGLYRARMPASRFVHVRLWVNDESMRLYGLEERIDEDFVRRHFPGSVGNLYRNMGGDYSWQGPEPENYVPSPWEPKEERLDHSIVPDFIYRLNFDVPSFGIVCDLDNHLEHLAGLAVNGDQDNLTGDWGGVHNYYRYFHPTAGRFFAIPWDPELTFGFDAPPGDPSPTRSIWRNFQNTRITALVEDTPALRTRYKEKIREIISTVATPAAIASHVDAMYLQIRDDVYADTWKVTTDEQFEAEREAIKAWAAARYDSLMEQTGRP